MTQKQKGLSSRAANNSTSNNFQQRSMRRCHL